MKKITLTCEVQIVQLGICTKFTTSHVSCSKASHKFVQKKRQYTKAPRCMIGEMKGPSYLPTFSCVIYELTLCSLLSTKDGPAAF